MYIYNEYVQSYRIWIADHNILSNMNKVYSKGEKTYKVIFPQIS